MDNTKTKASEEQFNELHGLVTEQLIERIKQGGECPTADLKTAIDWLYKNNITGPAADGTPLKRLLDGLTEEDQAFVERMVQ